MVSILVLMELPLQHIAVTLNIAEYAVSILVLMELPLQQQTDEYDGTVYCCFNPCFNGTTSATWNKSLNSMKYTNVSILVLMELPLQR